MKTNLLTIEQIAHGEIVHAIRTRTNQKPEEVKPEQIAIDGSERTG